MWRQKRKAKNYQNYPVNWPSGVFVETEREVWNIRGGSRVAVFSDRVLESWSVVPLIGTEKSLENYKEMTGYLGFRNGTLIKSLANNYYIVSDNKRRRITNPDVFWYMNLSRDNALEVSDEELDLHPEGEVLS